MWNKARELPIVVALFGIMSQVNSNQITFLIRKNGVERLLMRWPSIIFSAYKEKLTSYSVLLFIAFIFILLCMFQFCVWVALMIIMRSTTNSTLFWGGRRIIEFTWLMFIALTSTMRSNSLIRISIDSIKIWFLGFIIVIIAGVLCNIVDLRWSRINYSVFFSE